MRTIGVIATIISGVVGLGAVVLFVKSLPDIARYLKIREM